MKHLTAIVQLTERCNLDCRYCYVPQDGSDMSLQTFRVMLDKLLGSVGEEGSISLIYHGGEPLLRGLDFFRQANALVNARGGRKRIDACIQTNGTLINERFADFIVENNLPCGISLDGPEEIHDANRRHCRSQRGSFKRVMHGFKLLAERGRKASAIAVLTRASIAKIAALYQFFNGLNIDFKVNPVDLIGRSREERAQLEITPLEYGQALTELFDLWFNDPRSGIHIGNLYDAMRALSNGNYNECIYSNRACGGTYLGITPAGDVYPCNRFSSYAEFKLGNILQDSLPDLFSRQIFSAFGRRSAALERCGGCEYRSICHGGCTSRAYSYHHSINERDYYCPAIKLLFRHIERALEEEVLKVANLSGG